MRASNRFKSLMGVLVEEIERSPEEEDCVLFCFIWIACCEAGNWSPDDFQDLWNMRQEFRHLIGRMEERTAAAAEEAPLPPVDREADNLTVLVNLMNRLRLTKIRSVQAPENSDVGGHDPALDVPATLEPAVAGMLDAIGRSVAGVMNLLMSQTRTGSGQQTYFLCRLRSTDGGAYPFAFSSPPSELMSPSSTEDLVGFDALFDGEWLLPKSEIPEWFQSYFKRVPTGCDVFRVDFR